MVEPKAPCKAADSQAEGRGFETRRPLPEKARSGGVFLWRSRNFGGRIESRVNAWVNGLQGPCRCDADLDGTRQPGRSGSYKEGVGSNPTPDINEKAPQTREARGC